MTAVALAVHIFGAVIWVGGMFAIYVCLRPALGIARFGPARAGTSRRREHVNDPARDHGSGFRRIGGHVRCGGMRLERVGARPFLDCDESVRAEFRLESAETLGIDRSTIFDAAVFCAHSRNIGTKIFEHRVALPWVGGDDGENMDHDCCLLVHIGDKSNPGPLSMAAYCKVFRTALILIA
jgi:hypothetical protein